MAKRKEIELEYKIWLVEECLAKRMRGREAARRAGVASTTMENWISRYRSEGTAAFQPIESPRVYSEETRRKAAGDYLQGKGSLLAIAEKYKIRSPELIRAWVMVYNRHNETNKKTEGMVMAKENKYTFEKRIQIVEEHLNSGVSINALAQKYNTNYHTIYNWVKRYKEKGAAGLEDRRGKRTAEQTPRTPEEELRVRNAQLEREIYLLKMENDLLKKLNELEGGED